MSAKERKALANYVRECADALALRDWHFVIHHTDDELEPDVAHVNDDDKYVFHGEMQAIIGQRKAEIRLSPALRHEPRELVRHLVVHELAHCHLVKMRELVRTGLEPHLGRQSYMLFNHAFDLEWEHATDAFTQALAPLLPLIRWP